MAFRTTKIKWLLEQMQNTSGLNKLDVCFSYNRLADRSDSGCMTGTAHGQIPSIWLLFRVWTPHPDTNGRFSYPVPLQAVGSREKGRRACRFL